MTYFLLYVLSVAFVLSVVGIFVFLAGRLVVRDSADLLRLSLRSIVGGVDRALAGGRRSRRVTRLRHLQVQVAGERAGVAVGETLPLRLPFTTLGRSQENDLVLNDPLISSRHLSLSFEKGGWRILDRGSRNGTRLYPVGGSPIQVGDQPEKLSEGDVIEVGSIRLRLVP
jgi:hypothetical protein